MYVFATPGKTIQSVRAIIFLICQRLIMVWWFCFLWLLYIYMFPIQCMVKHICILLSTERFSILNTKPYAMQHIHIYWCGKWEIPNDAKLKWMKRLHGRICCRKTHVCAVLQAFCLMKMCKPSGIRNLFSISVLLRCICKAVAVSKEPSMQLVRMWWVENWLFYGIHA